MLKWVAIVVFALVTLGVIIFLFLPQVYLSVLVRTVWHNPIMDVVPTEKHFQINPADFPNSRFYSGAGMTFKVPWDNLEKKKETERLILLASANNSVAVLFPRESLVESMEKENPEDLKKMKSFFGSESYSNDYEFLKLQAFTTTSQLTPLTSPNEAVKKLVLLMLKTVFFVGTKGNIYYFDTGTVKGFEFFNSSPQGGHWVSELFDSQYHHFTVIVKGTEAEADFILSSINFKQ